MTTRTPGVVMNCPGCGTPVPTEEITAQFVGDVVHRPLRIGRCVAIGLVIGTALGLLLGKLFPHGRNPEISLGALLGVLVAILIATRYNARISGMPVDWWPNSVVCPNCGRVFGRYKEGDDRSVSVWP